MYASATLIAACLLGIASFIPFGILAWYLHVQRSLRSGQQGTAAGHDPGRMVACPSKRTFLAAYPEVDPGDRLPEGHVPSMKETGQRPNYIAPDDFRARGFAFTIRSGRTSLPRIAKDRGGYAVVSFLVYNTDDMSLFVRTRIYLN